MVSAGIVDDGGGHSPAVGGALGIDVAGQGMSVSLLPALMARFSVVPPTLRVAVEWFLWIGRWARLKYLRWQIFRIAVFAAPGIGCFGGKLQGSGSGLNSD